MNPNDQVLPKLPALEIDTEVLTGPTYTGQPAPVPNPAVGVVPAGAPLPEDDFVARMVMNFNVVLDQVVPASRFRTLIVYNYTPGPGTNMNVYAGTVDPSNLLGIVLAQNWKALPIPSGTAQIHIVMSAVDPTNCVVLACAQRMAPFSGTT